MTEGYKVNSSFKGTFILTILTCPCPWKIVARRCAKHTCLQQPVMLTQEDHRCSSGGSYFPVCFEAAGSVLCPCPAGRIRQWWALQWVSPPTRIPGLLLHFTLGLFSLPFLSLWTYPVHSCQSTREWSIGHGLWNDSDNVPCCLCELEQLMSPVSWPIPQR